MPLFEESLAQFHQLEDKPNILFGIEGVAAACARARQQGKMSSRRAARLFGAAEALRAATGWRLSPAYGSGYERYLAAARAELGEATFAAAWIEGSVLTLEQAVAEALNR
jgi:hypothetical protein